MEEVEAIRSELREAAEPDRVEVLQRFFRTGAGEYAEGDVLIGVRVPNVRRVVRRHRDLDLESALELLHSEIHEERLAALLLLVEGFKRRPDERERIYRAYLQQTEWINNWDLVDSSAHEIVGGFLLERDDLGIGTLRELAGSDSLWERRIAILATLAFIREGRLEPTIELCEHLLGDPHDLIHKACGWMLREAGKRDEALMVGFIEAHAALMPRTMLRYAIERLPEVERKRLMAL